MGGAWKFLTDFLNTNIGNPFVKKEHYKARVKTCQGCDRFGTVEPVPMLKLPGCTICGCPALTKPRTLKYYSFDAGAVIDTKCPHPDGSKWAEVDNLFLQ